MTPQERSQARPGIPVWWPLPAQNTLDRATSSLPKLMHARLLINNGQVMLCDEFPEYGHTARPVGGFNLHLQVDDAKAYTKPITARQVYKLKPDWELQEYVCEQNNKYTYQKK